MKPWQTIVVDASGVAEAKDLRALHEDQRIMAAKGMGFVPECVGPMIPEAPARGPIRTFEPMAAYPKGEDGFEYKPAGYMGRKALQRADSFDVMAAKAARHKKRPPFTPAQVAMGRFYRDIVEKHANAGVKCSSLEGRSQGGSGSGGEYMDAVLRDRQRIQVLRQRIGDGSALEVRRIRPTSRRSRITIKDRRLVDIVCLEDGTLSDVLRLHGWSNDARQRKALQQALRGILDRMMGPVRKGGESVAHFGAGCLPVWN